LRLKGELDAYLNAQTQEDGTVLVQEVIPVTEIEFQIQRIQEKLASNERKLGKPEKLITENSINFQEKEKLAKTQFEEHYLSYISQNKPECVGILEKKNPLFSIKDKATHKIEQSKCKLFKSELYLSWLEEQEVKAQQQQQGDTCEQVESKTTCQ